MSNIAISNETDLDWLARNVHEWPAHVDTIYVGAGIKFGVMGWCVTNIGFRRSSKTTKDQWLARRAELQKKPIWAVAPEWSQWLAQNSIGLWTFFRSKPLPNWGGGWSMDDGIPRDGNRLCVNIKETVGGIVLGDWRDTLEKRPEKTRAEAEVDLVNAVAEVFRPITSIEDNQELSMTQQQEVKQDNGWFERGELPTVGVECEMKHKYSTPDWARPGFEPVVIVASGKDLFISSGTDFYRETVGSWDEYEFRPIRTERELAVEEMKQHCPHHGSWDTVGRIYAEALYDAGYRKESK